MMINVLQKFGRQSTMVHLFTSNLLILAMSTLDYLTGEELSFSIFYLIPVSIAAWLVGRRAGIVVALLSACAWLFVDLTNHGIYSYPAIPYWNALVRFGFFLFITLALSSLRISQKQQEALMHFIVHDLRSPLATMMMGLDVLQFSGADNLTAKQQSVIKDSLTSGGRMLTLINSLLDLPRLEQGKMPLQLTSVNTAELGQYVLKEMAMFAQRRQVTLISRIDSHTPLVQADLELTRRVLLNLLGNAIKYSPQDSSIIMRVLAENNQLTFSVIDQGPGIPAPWRKKVFDKFAQVEARQTGNSIAGSGVGLNFCQLAVEAQGGKIWVEGNPESERGACFSFTLPIAAGDEPDRSLKS
jgi:signal transduction histidine kinase